MADLLLQSLFARGASAAPSQQLSVEEQQDAWEQSEQQWGEAAEPWAGPEEGEEPGGDGGEAGDGGECGGIDMDVSSAEVLRRIHSTALWFVSELCSGRLPEIEVASRAAANRALARADGEDEDGGGGGAQWVMRLQAQTQRRALLGRHPESAEQVARLFALLELVQQLLLTGAQATQVGAAVAGARRARVVLPHQRSKRAGSFTHAPPPMQREVWYKLKTLEVSAGRRERQFGCWRRPAACGCMPALALHGARSAPAANADLSFAAGCE